VFTEQYLHRFTSAGEKILFNVFMQCWFCVDVTPVKLVVASYEHMYIAAVAVKVLMCCLQGSFAQDI
jgi:hypothetical protein